MLWSVNHLRSYRIRATDDSLGSVEDVFFDDESWTVRYLVVDTAWLLGRRVLLPTSVLGHPDAAAREFPVSLDKEQVRNSPDIDTAQTVSRQQEIDLHGHYGSQPYWGAAAWVAPVLAGALPPPPEPAGPDGDAAPSAEADREARDPHLRSGRELVGYAIRASDGAVGALDDILIDEAGWVVRYLVVDTGNWLPGRKILLAPTWVSEISWQNREIAVNVSCGDVAASPDYNPSEDLGREYEDRLHQHYGRPGYWT